MSLFCVVTAADKKYFDLAFELIESVRSSDNSVPFGILDVGLSSEQALLLKMNNVTVVPAEWPFDFEAPHGLASNYLAMLSRPFLPKYFPGFDFIIWLDADTWVQIPSAINELIEATRGVDAVLVPEVHAAFSHLYSPASPLLNMHRESYTAVYGTEPTPPADSIVLNTGVVAARTNSILWISWQRALAKQVEKLSRATDPGSVVPITEQNAENHFLEQNALNYAFYTHQFTACFVSPVYNWVCTLAMPLYDAQSGMLTEPVAPFAPIRIVHLTGKGQAATYIEDRNGRRYDKRVRWSDFKQTSRTRYIFKKLSRLTLLPRLK